MLCGESNCAKTHTAKAIFQACRSLALASFEAGGWDECGHVPSTTFTHWPGAVDEFKQRDNDGARAAKRLFDEMCECDLLVIDDIGADDDPFKIGAGKLCQMLSRRESKFSAITTNIPVEQWASMLDTRIADRMFRNSEIVNLFGLESYALR